MRYRVGLGFDVHPFGDEPPLILGGVPIEDAPRLARDQAEDGRQVGSGQSQVTAGSGADEKADIGYLRRGRRCGTLAQLDLHRGRRADGGRERGSRGGSGKRLCHDGNPRRLRGSFHRCRQLDGARPGIDPIRQ